MWSPNQKHNSKTKGAFNVPVVPKTKKIVNYCIAQQSNGIVYDLDNLAQHIFISFYCYFWQFLKFVVMSGWLRFYCILYCHYQKLFPPPKTYFNDSTWIKMEYEPKNNRRCILYTQVSLGDSKIQKQSNVLIYKTSFIWWGNPLYPKKV